MAKHNPVVGELSHNSGHRQPKFLHSTRITYPLCTFFLPVLSDNNNLWPNIQSYISRLSPQLFLQLSFNEKINWDARNFVDVRIWNIN